MFRNKEKLPLLDSSGEQNIQDHCGPTPRKSAAREWIESLVFSLIFVFFFTTFIAQATQVPTESMKPTILVGDHFFLDKFAFPANYPEFMTKVLPTRHISRGEIVAFKSPENPKIPFIKRVIGLPNDTLEIRDKVVYINGKPLDEPYKFFIDPNVYERGSGIPARLHCARQFGPKTIPPDCYFMMGDNRDNSNDSRYWGVVKGSDVIGKPLFVYWSYEADPYDPRPKSDSGICPRVCFGGSQFLQQDSLVPYRKNSKITSALPSTELILAIY